MRRIPGALLSVVLHALVVLGLSNLAWRAPEKVASAPRAFAWLATSPRAVGAPSAAREEEPEAQRERPSPAVQEPVVTEEEPEPAAAEEQGAELAERPADLNSPADRADRAAPVREAATSSTASAASNPPLGLSEARERAIESVLEARDTGFSYRSFIFPGTLGEHAAFDEAERRRRVEAGLQAPLTAFDSPSKGRAGLGETTALGVSVRWVSDDCYQTRGTGNLFILPSAQWLYGATTTNCVRRNARGDLFTSAKPTYLMDAAERDAADERSQRMERLRRPTTGAVMDLEE